MHKGLFDKEPSLLVVDLFCGAGGTSTGFVNSGIAKVIACVNHDHTAIVSHWANHPDVYHFEEDMRYLDLNELIAICSQWCELYPNARLILWASLECTNFSKAKGGMARDADSRTLADHLHRYIEAIFPDMVWIENVTEFRDWGPVRIKAKKYHENYTELTVQKNKHKIETYGYAPIPELKGVDFKRWCNEVCAHGYINDWKELNSADFGAFTSRNRLFGQFVRPGSDMIWPEKTHAKKGIAAEQWDELKDTVKIPLRKWKAVKHVLDFSDQGYTIFDRGNNTEIPPRQRKDLSPKTFERIYAGLIKFVAGGKENFIAKTYAVASNSDGVFSTDVPSHTLTTRSAQQVVQAEFLPFISRYNGDKPESRNTSVDEPCNVITTENRHSLISPVPATAPFISKYYSGKPEGKNISVEGPAGTVTTIDGQALIQAQFIVQRNSGDPEGRVVSIDGPARTLTATAGNQDLVAPSFISTYHGNGHNCHSVDNPAPVIPTKDSLALVETKYILNYQHSSNSNDINAPAPTLTTHDKYAIVNPSFLDKQYTGPANNQSVDTPAGTVMPNDKHALVNTVPFITRQFSGGGQTSSVDDPAGSITSVPKLNLCQAEMKFIMNTNYDNKASGLNDPLNTITADRHYAYLVNPSWFGNPHSTDVPSPVIVASQHKAPLYLVQTESGRWAIEIFERDLPIVKQIKEFMALYGIIDIKMRMLVVKELLRIQGFPKGYILSGTQAEQKKFIGNSVVPDVVEAWARAVHFNLTGEHSMAA